MKNKILSYCLLIFGIAQGYSQEKVTLSGSVADIESNETLLGVNIYIKELNTGVVTNSYGFYSITVPKGDYTLLISCISYATVEEKISLSQSLQKNFSLAPESTNLDEITITTNTQKVNIKKAEMSVNKLSMSTIKKMPAVLGEVDVLKSILQLPGVATAQEGASGFNVRGGSVDGNLVLLDEAVVYNTSHLFGFLSVFNSDIIKDLK